MRLSNSRIPPGFEMSPTGLIIPEPKHLLGPDGQPITAAGPQTAKNTIFFPVGAQNPSLKG